MDKGKDIRKKTRKKSTKKKRPSANDGTSPNMKIPKSSRSEKTTSEKDAGANKIMAGRHREAHNHDQRINKKKKIDEPKVIKDEIKRLKKGNQSLEERGRMFDRLMDFVKDQFYLFDKDLNLMDINKAGLQMHSGGKNKKEIIGLSCRNVLPFLAADRLNKYKEVIRHNKNFSASIAVHHVVLGKRFLNIRAFKVGTGMGVIISDVTDQENAVAALRESREKYRAIIDTIEDGYFEVDVAGNMLFFNKPISNILGYSMRDMRGINNRQFMDEFNARKVYTTFNKVYRTGRPEKAFDWEIIRKDGEKRYIEASVSLIYSRDGNPTGFRGIVRDITDRKLAVQALKDSEEKYRLLVDYSIQGVIVVQDFPPKIIFANPAIAKILGYSIDELTHLSYNKIKKLFHPDDMELFLKRYRERITGGDAPPHYQFRAVRKDGSLCWLEMFATSIEYCGKKTVQASFVDITERKLAEEELRKTHDELEVHVEERTAQLLEINSMLEKEVAERKKIEDELRKHRDHLGDLVAERTKDLEKANRELLQEMREHKRLEEELLHSRKMESIGRLAGGVAHDLNNMLTPIIGYTDMLLMDFPMDSVHLDSVLQIKEAADRARDLSKQLLAFSRKQVIEMRVINLGEVVEGFESILRRTIRENIELEFNIDKSSGNIRSDQSQIEQVLLNLAVNAQDAMPDGGHLFVKVSDVELDGTFAANHPGIHEGPYVMLSISDTGCGMDSDTMEKMFEPFFTTREKGTGLGLATVYGIVKQHGGDIYVKSKPGVGSTFNIFFPHVYEKADEDTRESSFHYISRGGEVILIVEDEKAVQKLAAKILEKHGYGILFADNGEEALRIVAEYEGRIDLLLTDVVMPKIDGKELYLRISAMRKDIKVLYMSGYTREVITHHGIIEKGVHFLQKPFSVMALTEKVRDVLDEKDK